MGSKTKRLQRLKREHPICYFCATNPTETEDHVPSRECFRNRVWPEGYVFPACKRCNHASSQFEQVVALYLMMANHDEAEPAADQFRKLVFGVANNNPELLPGVNLGARAARNHFRERGLMLAPGKAYADTPILELPAKNRAAFELFSRRLTCALFYKEVGRPVPLDHSIISAWTPWAEPNAHVAAMKAVGVFPQLCITNRRNVDIEGQFTYRWGVDDAGSVFGFAAEFSRSYFIFGAVAAPSLNPVQAGWKLHAEDITPSL